MLVRVDDIRFARRGWVNCNTVGKVWELFANASSALGVVAVSVTDFDTGFGVLLTVRFLGVWFFVALIKMVLVNQKIALVDWLAPWILLVFWLFTEIGLANGHSVLNDSKMNWDLTNGDWAVSSIVTVSDWFTVFINQVRWKITLVGGSRWIDGWLAVGPLWTDDNGGFRTGFVVKMEFPSRFLEGIFGDFSDVPDLFLMIWVGVFEELDLGWA